MSIPRAYCVEHECVVTARGASHHYFSQRILPRTDLNFQCPNPKCRVTIFCVNYKSMHRDRGRLPTVYFRTHIDHPHTENCPFIKIVAKRRTRLAILDELPEVSFFNPVLSDIEGDDIEINVGIDAEDEGGVGLVLDEEGFNEGRELKLQKKKTRDLDALTQAFEELRDLDKKRADGEGFLDKYKISIFEKQKAFRWWFKYIPYACPKKGGRIYYGHVHVSKNSYRYKLAFLQKTDKNEMIRAGLSIAAYIPLSVFARDDAGNLLRKLLDRYCDEPKERLSAYIFAKAEISKHIPDEVKLNITDLCCVSMWVTS